MAVVEKRISETIYLIPGAEFRVIRVLNLSAQRTSRNVLPKWYG